MLSAQFVEYALGLSPRTDPVRFLLAARQTAATNQTGCRRASSRAASQSVCEQAHKQVNTRRHPPIFSLVLRGRPSTLPTLSTPLVSFLMQISLFSATPGDAATLDEINGFLRSHCVLTLEKHWTGTAWTFCVTWQETGQDTAGGTRRKERVDYKKVLPPEIFKRYLVIHALRKKIAKEINEENYNVIGNDEMALIAQLPPPVKLSDVKKIEGIGDKTIAKCGTQIVAVLEKYDNPSASDTTTGNKDAPASEASSNASEGKSS